MSDRKRLVILQSDLEGLKAIKDNFDDNGFMFQQTFNDFLIMSGLCPDIPIGVRQGMASRGGIWQNGLLYIQHEPWEDHIDTVFGRVGSADLDGICINMN